MRVISGKYKGRKLLSPSYRGIRPTTDRAKEAFFSILCNRITSHCVFIDAFCGSGAIGIEALSRGVEKVYFIDSNKEAIALLKKNLVGIEGNFEILHMDSLVAFKRLNKRDIKADIIFCDPPYKKDLSDGIIDILDKHKIINYGGLLIIEKDKKLLPTLHKNFHHCDERIYASTRFDFYKREKRCAITGTFDPFTLGHLDLVMQAKNVFDKVYIVILINEEKTMRYSLPKRKDIITRAIKNIGENVVVDSYGGLAIDYCNNNDIQYVLRGVRDAQDMEYEYKMAKYNYTNGGINTLIMPAKQRNISSTAVKEGLDASKDISNMVDKDIIEILKE